MAYILPLQPHSPLKRSFSDTPYVQSYSSVSLVSCAGTVRHNATYSASTASLALPDPLYIPSKRPDCENTPPRHASPGSTKFYLEIRGSPRSFRNLELKSRQTSVSTESKAPSLAQTSLRTCDPDSTDNLAPLTRVHSPESIVGLNTEKKQGEVDEPAKDCQVDVLIDHQNDVLSPTAAQGGLDLRPSPFRKWVETLRRRSVKLSAATTPQPQQSSNFLGPRLLVTTESGEEDDEQSPPRKSGSYSSSTGFVTAVKTASVTLASVSVGPFRRRISRTYLDQHSSGNSEIRASMDSYAHSLAPVLDEATWLRSVQRRNIIDEIISSEESYVSDMKAFVNVYMTLLASVPSISSQLQASVGQTVTQIVQLHEGLLMELRKLVPDSGDNQDTQSVAIVPERPKHARWHSADIAPPRIDARKPTRKLRHSLDIGRTNAVARATRTADTYTAADVARVFNTFMRRFFVYEAWAAQSEIMHTAVISTYRTVPTTTAIERGLEALANVEGSINSRALQGRKGLTLLDLLIKPIQRVCKYPLLFENLCKQTPACDDPVSHNEIQKVLIRLREVTDEINKATDNPQTRQLVEATWTLQDRLMFEEHMGNAPSIAVIFRLLGRVILCGALHIAYETKSGVKGQFMICVLYRSCLLLARPSRNASAYIVTAMIPLLNGRLDDPDNGRGLQCHTAPHTWKLIFESKHRLYELMLSACSQQEEDAWRSTMKGRISAEARDFAEGREAVHDLFCYAPVDVISLGSAYGHPESLARRMSIQRAATLGPTKASTRQVIIKNTQVQRQPVEACQPDHTPTRSNSYLSTAHIPTLAPRRAERIRLENLLCDIWTKDAIPYPGMLQRRAENPIRASANSMMRKLSMASIASNFSKRSTSFASTNNGSLRASTASHEDTNSCASHSSDCSRTRPALDSALLYPLQKVDFHNAPDAFLPEDFELHRNRHLQPQTEHGYRTRSFTSRMADLSMEYARNLRPLTPMNPSAPPTPKTAKADLVAPLITLKGATALPNPTSGVDQANFYVERKGQGRPEGSPGSNRALLRRAVTEKAHEVKQHKRTRNALRQIHSPPLRDGSNKESEKPNKVKSMLFKLWPG